MDRHSSCERTLTNEPAEEQANSDQANWQCRFKDHLTEHTGTDRLITLFVTSVYMCNLFKWGAFQETLTYKCFWLFRKRQALTVMKVNLNCHWTGQLTTPFPLSSITCIYYIQRGFTSWGDMNLSLQFGYKLFLWADVFKTHSVSLKTGELIPGKTSCNYHQHHFHLTSDTNQEKSFQPMHWRRYNTYSLIKPMQAVMFYPKTKDDQLGIAPVRHLFL